MGTKKLACELSQWHVVLLVLLAGGPGCSGRRTSINTGVCRLQSLRPNMNPQHVRLFYWTLPVDMADEVRGYCGSMHMAPWDGMIVDSNPLGVHLEQPTRGQHTGYYNGASGCSFGHLHATKQFAAEAFWRQQALISPLWTDDVNMADVVVVDLVDEYCMSLSINDHKNKTVREQFWHKAMSLLYQHVSQTNKPHLVPLSRPALWYWGADGGPDLLSHEAAQKVTWLSTELTDANWAGMHRTKHTLMDYFVVAQPYPTTIHYRSHDPYFAALHAQYAHSDDGLGIPYARHLLTPPHSHPCYITRKTLLATGSFGDRYPIRHALKKQCKAAGEDKCVHYDVTRQTFFKMLPEVTEALGRAWFCLTPPGDTHSRRSLVDCLMQDTIPVVFSNHTRDTLPYSDIINPAEYVASLHELAPSLRALGAPVKEGENVPVMEEAKDILGLLEARYPLHVRMRIIHKIFTIKHLFQPMIDPVHQLIRFDQLDAVHCLDDAFTSSFKAALRSMCRRQLLPPQRCSTR